MSGIILLHSLTPTLPMPLFTPVLKTMSVQTSHHSTEVAVLPEFELNQRARSVPDAALGAAVEYAETHAYGDKDHPLAVIHAKTAEYPKDYGWKARHKRVLGSKDYPSHCYHAMSRTCGGAVHWDSLEKEALRRILRRLAEFSGIRVLTYCIMKNHFHVLAEVPQAQTWLLQFEGLEGEERLLEHLRILYSKGYVEALRVELAQWRRVGQGQRAASRIAAIKKRFCDLPHFIKEVKERFSRWYNKRHKRRGTLWMDRFKSVLVEGRGDALRTMALYIDLNAVRVGLVSDPKDYRWCGYADALTGDAVCRRGLCRAMSEKEGAWGRGGAEERYRQQLYSSGIILKDDGGKVTRRGVTREAAEGVRKRRGKLSVAELAAHRMRYFCEGVVLGGREFVESVFEEQREQFSPKRKRGARKVPRSDADIFTLRVLK